jgi:osmotically-inducible protein OsmY
MALTNTPLIADRQVQLEVDRAGVAARDHWYQRASAISAVKRVPGVTGVSDHIVVTPPLRTDEELRLEIKTALDRHFPLEAIDVTVDQGAATLMGTVATYRMQEHAGHLAWATTVRTVTNRILIDGPPLPMRRTGC